MPVLPLIDLLIILGWTSLMGAFLLKAIYLTTAYRPLLLGMGPSDFAILAGVCLLFALTLAARTWVKYHEPELVARRRRAMGEGAGVGDPRGAGLRPVREPERAAADQP